MAREVDEKKKRKAQRILRRVSERAKDSPKPLTDWEKEFVQGVGERLETYGSAFRDPGKGRLEEALSVRQTHIMRQLDKKTRKPAEDPEKPDPGKPDHGKPRGEQKPRSGLRRKSPMKPSKQLRGRQPAPEDETEADAPPRPSGPPVLRVVPGGKS